MTTKIISTPESSFSNLKDYPFKSNYIDLDGLKKPYSCSMGSHHGVTFTGT